MTRLDLFPRFSITMLQMTLPASSVSPIGTAGRGLLSAWYRSMPPTVQLASGEQRLRDEQRPVFRNRQIDYP